MATVIGDVELYMGPRQVGAPDDLEKVIVGFIDGARSRMDIAVQELESMPIAEAILRARKRGCRVRLVVESDYLSVSRAVAQPFSPSGTNEANRIIYNAMLRANAKVRSDFNADIFHQKFIVRDGSAVLTGSTNFTPTGVENNLNHVVIVTDAKIARAYRKEFEEINRGQFGKYSVAHEAVPEQAVVSNVPVKALFAPDHNPEMEIMKQIAKAQQRIDFAIFTFSQSSGIDDALIQAHNAGVKVRGALDGMSANQTWAATRPVKNAGAELYLVRRKGSLGKLHHKLMVIDEKLVIGGSFNYTGPATRLNDENIIILGTLGTVTATVRAAQGRMAKFALKEIDRIIKVHGEEIT